MLFKEIEVIFTRKVSDLIQKGYAFNCNTMSGHQGEIAKVDLRKGGEIIRVLMCEEFNVLKGNKLCVVVGRSSKKVGRYHHETIWNGDLEIIEEVKFYEISKNFYVETEEEYNAIRSKRIERSIRRRESRIVTLDEAAKKIVLPFVKRQRGFKSCSAKNIERVEKHCAKNRTRYVVIAKGESIALR